MGFWASRLPLKKWRVLKIPYLRRTLQAFVITWMSCSSLLTLEQSQRYILQLETYQNYDQEKVKMTIF